MRSALFFLAVLVSGCGARAPRIQTVGDMGQNGPIRTAYASMREARPPLVPSQVTEIEPRDLAVCGVVSAGVEEGTMVADETLRAELRSLSATLGCEFVTNVAYVQIHHVRTAVGLSATAREPVNGMRLVMPQGGQVDRAATMSLSGWPTHWGRRINNYLFRQASRDPRYVFVVDGFGGRDTSREYGSAARADRTSGNYTIEGHWVIDPSVPMPPPAP